MTKTTSTPLDPVDVAIGGRIRARREQLRITQAQLAAGAGVTFQQIQKYERGVNRIAAARLIQIAAVLKTTGAALLGELDGPGGEDLALAHPGVAELLQAFRGITDEAKRDALLTVALSLASPAPVVGRHSDLADHTAIIGTGGVDHRAPDLRRHAGDC